MLRKDPNVSEVPPVCHLPTGTGNDLARAFGWGGALLSSQLPRALAVMGDADVVPLDRSAAYSTD